MRLNRYAEDIRIEKLLYWFHFMSYVIVSFLCFPKSFSPKESLYPPPGQLQIPAKPLRSIRKVSVIILLSDFFFLFFLPFSEFHFHLTVLYPCHLQVLCLRWLLRSQKNTQVGVSFERLWHYFLLTLLHLFFSPNYLLNCFLILFVLQLLVRQLCRYPWLLIWRNF